MSRASILQPITPISFDPSNKAHRQAYAHFLARAKWPDGIRFAVEEPYTSSVTTCEAKLVQYALRVELKELATTDLQAA